MKIIEKLSRQILESKSGIKGRKLSDYKTNLRIMTNSK